MLHVKAPRINTPLGEAGERSQRKRLLRGEGERSERERLLKGEGERSERERLLRGEGERSEKKIILVIRRHAWKQILFVSTFFL